MSNYFVSGSAAPVPAHRAVRLLPLLALALLAVPAANVPTASGAVYPTSSRDAYWIVVTDDDDTRTVDEAFVRNDIFARANSLWAANSGGKVQHDLVDILYARIPLNADGTRPTDYRTTVNTYVQNNYGIDLTGKLKIFDVNYTTRYPDQGWAGLAIINGERMELQSRTFSVYAHELGHIYGRGHSSGFRPGDGNMYVWNAATSKYVTYTNNTSAGPHTPMPFGIDEAEYGHANSIMGNNGTDHISTNMKRAEGWLQNKTNQTLSYAAAHAWAGLTTTLRLYAHNDLQSVVDTSGAVPRYGVTQGYDQNLKYSLEYERVVKRWSTDRWSDVTQKVMMEYWFDDNNPGLNVYIDPNADDSNNELIQVDVNTLSGWQLNPKNDTTLSDLDLGTSFYIGNGDTFISENPLAPLNPLTVLPEYFNFTLLGGGVTDGRNYMDVRVNLVPEPSSIAMLGLAALALSARRRTASRRTAA